MQSQTGDRMATKADPYAGIDFDEINEVTGENIFEYFRKYFSISFKYFVSFQHLSLMRSNV